MGHSSLLRLLKLAGNCLFRQSLMHFLVCLINLFEPVLFHNFDLERLDGHHVVFGKVLSGMDVVFKIEAEGNQGDGKPKTEVSISQSGELPV